ncbi:hypothetical protein DER45DRAFT_259235 [Fusarium avenaceum]|nr:hypothetical protein DER45DRAFT_259235 [Fusarium avenaceum]
MFYSRPIGITRIMATTSSPSVADYVLACLHRFKILHDTPHNWESDLERDASQRKDTEQSSLLKLKDEQSRLMVWSGNIGAHKNGRSSLDYRLRDASNIRDHVIQILCNLIELLGDTKEILEGKTTPSYQHQLSLDKLSDDSDDESFPLVGLSVASELSQILLSIGESINCLFRLSVSIHNPFPHDRLKKSSSTDASHFEPFDIDHVRTKFAMASDTITERLGKANSRRRQYFKYRELHHERLASGLDDSEGHIAESTVASSLPPGLSLGDPTAPELREAETESAISDTSYATSGTRPGQRKIPAFPAGAQDRPFECPFCFIMISAPSKHLWKKHVFSDLCPYICVELGCPAPDQDFQRRHQWVDHVQKFHWKIWICHLGCDKTFTSLDDVTAHLTLAHPEAVISTSLKNLLSVCERPKPADDSVECALCKERLGNFKQYQKHVGRHQEDLALFTLPKHFEDDDENDDDEQLEAKEGETGDEDKFETQDTPLDSLGRIITAHQGPFSDHSLTGSYVSMSIPDTTPEMDLGYGDIQLRDSVQSSLPLSDRGDIRTWEWQPSLSEAQALRSDSLGLDHIWAGDGQPLISETLMPAWRPSELDEVSTLTCSFVSSQED